MKGKTIPLMLLAMLILGMAGVFTRVKADVSDVEFYVSPANNYFDTTTTPVGTQFNITVMWKDSGTPLNNVYAWQVNLRIDTTMLNCTRAWAPTWDPDYLLYPRKPDWLHPAASGLGTNEITVMGSLQSPATPVQDRSARLAIFQLNITRAPVRGNLSCVLDIDNSDTTWSPDGTHSWYDPIRTNGNYVYSSPGIPPPTAMIQVDPARMVDPLLTPCHNFTVDMTISDATDVYSYGFKLGYNKTLLHATEAQLGNFFPPTVVPTVTIDNVVGFVQFSASLAPPEPPRSGAGSLATIKFHVEAQGNCSLNLYDVQIFDNTSQILPSETRDGYFNNALIASLYVDPPEIIDPTLVPPKTFEVNVTLDNVENLYGYEFNMSFNKDVLTCLYVIVNDVLNETNYTPETQVSNAKGFVWVNVTYYPPTTPITTYTPVALATICFRVKSMGASPLDLHDTSLTDSFGNPISHEVTDGFVATVNHDVAVTRVTPLRDWVYAGWPVSIEVVARNLGNMSESFYADARCNDTLISSMLVTSLAPDTETMLTFVWDTTGVTEGNYRISANATIVPYDINASNNLCVDGYVSVFTTKRDVAIMNVVPEVPWAYQGWVINITVEAANLGEIDETFNVTAYYDNSTLGTLSVSLTAGMAMNLTFTWDTSTAICCHNYTMWAEASAVPYEYNATNNVFVDGAVKIRMVGDLNDDGKIDVRDVAAASAAYGSYRGHPRWNPAADINRDGKIDVRDIAAICSKFGQHC
jgi:hypothetical protein